MSNLPPRQIELNERVDQATTDEELEQLILDQEQLDRERAEVLSRSVAELAISADGIVIDKSALEAERAAGHEVTGSPYDNGRRS